MTKTNELPIFANELHDGQKTAATVKIALVVAFLWITSPVCTHLIGRLVRETEEEKLEAEAKEWKR